MYYQFFALGLVFEGPALAVLIVDCQVPFLPWFIKVTRSTVVISTYQKTFNIIILEV